MIQLRRNPWIAFAFLAVGGITLGIGLYFAFYIAVASGVLLIGGGGMVLMNPAVTIEKNQVILKNLLGITAVSYEHDGIDQLSIVEDKLLIRSKGRQAIIQHISKNRYNKADWNLMERAFAELGPKRKTK